MCAIYMHCGFSMEINMDFHEPSLTSMAVCYRNSLGLLLGFLTNKSYIIRIKISSYFILMVEFLFVKAALK